MTCMGGHERGELLRDFGRQDRFTAELAVGSETVLCSDPTTDIVDLRDLGGTAERSFWCASSGASPAPSTPTTNSPRSSEFPPPGRFSWFERGSVVVVEGEVEDSRVEVEGAEADSLSPARSGC